MNMRLRIDLPEKGVTARGVLNADAAPAVCEFIWEALARPLETRTAHACFDGHEVFCFLPPLGRRPPLENRTMRPRPGDIMFFFAGENDFASTKDDRLSGGTAEVRELAFMYGETDLRHFWEDGFHGSLVGRITDNLEAFSEACLETLSQGSTKLVVSREEQDG